ncbi:Protein of unknown function [Bacillus toyonensis]|nr:Protein of unknown function [Bacillus toyonensis]
MGIIYTKTYQYAALKRKSCAPLAKSLYHSSNFSGVIIWCVPIPPCLLASESVGPICNFLFLIASFHGLNPNHNIQARGG